MGISFEGIGLWAATFACGETTVGQVVKISGNGEVVGAFELFRHKNTLLCKILPERQVSQGADAKKRKKQRTTHLLSSGL